MQAFNAHPTIPLAMESEMLIEILDLNLRIKSKYVGVEEGQFVIVKIFDEDLTGDFNSETIKEHPVTAIFKDNEIVCRFEARILNVVSEPARLLFLEYPKDIEKRGPRKKRHVCQIPAQTMLGNEIVDIDIIDLSSDGCLCTIAKTDFEKDKKRAEHMIVGKKADILVNFPVTNEALSLPGIIRNSSKGGIIKTNCQPSAAAWSNCVSSCKADIANFLLHY